MSRRPSSQHDLAICEECRSNTVEPTAWEAAEAGEWRVALRCPNCQHCREDVFSQECVDRFDEHLDEACTQMITDLRRLEQAIFAEEVERFVGALQAGAILADDFAIAEVVR